MDVGLGAEVGDRVGCIGVGCVVHAPNKSKHKYARKEKAVLFMILLRVYHSTYAAIL